MWQGLRRTWISSWRRYAYVHLSFFALVIDPSEHMGFPLMKFTHSMGMDSEQGLDSNALFSYSEVPTCSGCLIGAKEGFSYNVFD